MLRKILAAGIAAFVLAASGVAVAAPGDLDPAFGYDGEITVDLSDPTAVDIAAIAVNEFGYSHLAGTTADGRIALAGVGVAGDDDGFWNGRALYDAGEDAAARAVVLHGDALYVAGAIGDDMGLLAVKRSGTPVRTFGRNGFARIPFGKPAMAEAVVPTHDGTRLLVAGTVDDAGSLRVAVTRLRLDGTVDTAFGTNGVVITDLAGEDDVVHDLAVEPNASGAFVVVGESAGHGFVARYTAAGALDAGFGTGGVVTVDMQPGTDAVYSALYSASDRIVVGGKAGKWWTLAAYTETGAADGSFAYLGDPGGTSAAIRSLAWRSGGRIVAAAVKNGTTPLVLAFTAAGSMDTTFAGSGSVYPAVPAGAAVDIGASGTNVAVALATEWSPSIAIYNADGSPMTTRTVEGIKELPFGEFLDDRITAVTRDGSGRLFAAASSQGDVAVLRFTPEGELDEAFGDLGVALVQLGTGEPAAIALAPDGGIVVLTSGMALLRFTAAGALDRSFGTDGLVALGADAVGARSLLVQPDGRIVAVGADALPGTRFAVYRRMANGSPDTSFDGDGVLFDTAGDQAHAVGRQVDGKLVVAGVDVVSGTTQLVVTRYTASGAPDAGFTGHRSNAWSADIDMVVMGDGRIVTAQPVGSGIVSDLAVRRFLASGAADHSFASQGSSVVHVHGQDRVSALAVQPDGATLVMSGVWWNPWQGTPTVERLAPDGLTDSSFGQDGEWAPEGATAIALLAHGERIVVAGQAYVDTDQDAWLAQALAVDVPPPPPPPPAPPKSGYWMVAADGSVYAFGDAAYKGGAAPAIVPSMRAGVTAVDIEPRGSTGYWIVDNRGHVFAFGDARYLGGSPALAPGEQVTSLSATPTGDGYWLFTTLGRVVAYGAARHLGDMTGVRLNGPVLDSVPTPDGNGYYMVASDGGIFAFGTARFRGSMGGHRLNAPVQSLVPDPDGTGYWLVASDGGVFSFDATFRGSMGSVRLNKPVTGMVAYGNGYLMVGADGGIFNFADKPFLGSLGANPPPHPVVSVAAVR